MTEQPKSQDMVEAWSALSATNLEHGHQGLETSLRNKSGKVAIHKNVQVILILPYFFFHINIYYYAKVLTLNLYFKRRDIYDKKRKRKEGLIKGL